jgi:aryl-alcohol dehydrogenase-like predicted oxidoreductase
MHTRTFGRLGWQVSEVGYGLWGVGGWTGSDDAESMEAIERSLALGCTFFDTALAYGNGKSEELLGRVLARHPSTALGTGPSAPPGTGRLIVATKIPPKNLQWPARATYALSDVYPADHIRRSTETSLKNLGISSMDLQQFHVWHDNWAEDDRWQRAVDDLKREGLVRAIGISLNRWEPANGIKALRTGLIDSVQVVYNVFDQNPEDELFPVCRELGVAVIARVPFDEGSLTGTMTRNMTWPEGDFRNIYFAPDKLPEILDHVDRLREDVPAGMTMPELVLRFILANPDVATIIPGMRRPKHVQQNLGVSDGRPLPAELLQRLRKHRWVRTYDIP